MGTRPRIKIKKTSFDRCIEAITVLIMLAQWIVVLLFYSKLPETVPMHYNIAGEIDGWGNRSLLLILLVLSTIMYIGITFLQKVPHFYNYAAIEITMQNAEDIYRTAVRMIRILKLLMAAMFTLITIRILQDALNTFWFVQFWMLYGTLVLMAVSILFYSVKMIILNYRINKGNL